MTRLTRIREFSLENTFAGLPEAFFSRVRPTPLPVPRLAAFDDVTAARLGCAPGLREDPEFLRWVAGALDAPGAFPVATVYAGHQFGVWVPQLGDGRAILLGELRDEEGVLWDLQLKGAGRTPYSRQGDGRAVTRSVVREYLAGIAMRGLGIPTTGALAMIVSDEPVQRETREQAAALLRVARSHIRFGHFEYFYYHHGRAELQLLTDYVIRRSFPGLQGRPDAPAALFHEVCRRTARMIAAWMSVGFQHGVMNTDNMSIIGDTIDYGPYGFMDRFDPAWICNHSDHTGRYAFMQQPGIGLWNLGRLARALTPLAPEEALVAGLEEYQREVVAQHQAMLGERLGFTGVEAGDDELLMDLLALMHRNGVDYSNVLRDLAGFDADTRCDAVRNRFADLAGIDAWLERYARRLRMQPEPAPVRQARQRACNPRFILRNHVAQEVINAAEAGDFAPLADYAAVLARPHEAWPQHAAWAEDAPDWARQLEISCSS